MLYCVDCRDFHDASYGIFRFHNRVNQLVKNDLVGGPRGDPLVQLRGLLVVEFAEGLVGLARQFVNLLGCKWLGLLRRGGHSPCRDK